MNHKPASVETQLRLYADAIDPHTARTSHQAGKKRRGPNRRSSWLIAAAAAALVVLVGVTAIAQREPAQQVEAGGFAQQPDDVPDDPTGDFAQQPEYVPDDPTGGTRGSLDTNDEPIYWPGGSTDPVETVERFMDLSFPTWRDLSLEAFVARAPLDKELTSSSTAIVEIRHRDDSIFATAPLRFADGRWFLNEISSPLLHLTMTRQLRATHMEGSAVVQAAGVLQVQAIYAFERTVQSTTSITISADHVGATIPIILEQSHQEVQAQLVSPTNELLAIAVFTAPTSLPPASASNHPPRVMDPTLPGARADGVTVYYVVEPGDTLGHIASSWTVSLEALLGANPELDPGGLQVGQLLTIPPWGSGLDPADLQTRPVPSPVQLEPTGVLEHTVAPGDFISAIAETYGVTVQQILISNGLDSGGGSLQVGQVLLIPPPE